MAISQRTVGIPKNYKTEESEKVSKLNSTYLGFVKDNSDSLKMGRIKVWIPELSSDPAKGLYTVNFCSPFAGASGLNAVSNSSQSQTSYGMHLPPPDLENEVIVLFINGDPNRGVYIGGMFQQYMNNMVPGIPKGDTTGSGGSQAPVQEYSKKDSSQATKDNPQRPTYDVLDKGLKNQGLDKDDVRGQSTSSARRESPSKVLGILSPGGSQIVVDDDPDSQFIRFRTKSGAQVLINDTIGCIYMITKNGNSWLELSDDGICIYSSRSISLRAQEDFNIHADKKLNLFAAEGINIGTSKTVAVTGSAGINLTSGKDINQSAIGSINLITNSSANISAKIAITAFSRGSLALTADDNIGITTSTDIYVSSSKSYTNSKDGPVATGALDVTPPKFGTMSDKALNSSHADLSTNSNNSTLPTHEPFAGHSEVSSDPTQKPINLNNSTPTNADNSGDGQALGSSSGGSGGSSKVIQQGQDDPSSTIKTQTGDETPVPQGNDTGFYMPVSGTVTSPFGPRPGEFHPGVDVGGNNGKTIVAAKSGKVIWAGEGTPGSGYNGYGNAVGIDHGGGLKTLYGHMSSVSVTKGQMVTQGQTLGQVGNTGMSRGAHLHFGVYVNGSATDPKYILPRLASNGTSVTSGGSGTMIASAKPPATMTNASAATVTSAQTGTANT